MEAKLYYTPPIDDIFEDLKSCSIELWSKKYDNQDYIDEKVGKIQNLENIGDNFMFMFAMFDQDNQKIIGLMVSDKTREAIRERLIDGGQPEWAMPF